MFLPEQKTTGVFEPIRKKYIDYLHLGPTLLNDLGTAGILISLALFGYIVFAGVLAMICNASPPNCIRIMFRMLALLGILILGPAAIGPLVGGFMIMRTTDELLPFESGFCR